MSEVTRDSIMAAVSKAKPFTIVLLKRGPNFDSTEHLHMDHLKHVFSMRESGQQPITFPITDAGEIVGISLMATANKEEASALVAADPGVEAGRFVFEVLSCMGLPGDAVR